MTLAVRTDRQIDGIIAIVIGALALAGIAGRIPSLHGSAGIAKLAVFSTVALVIVGYGVYRLRVGLNRAVITIDNGRFRVTHSVRARDPWTDCNVAADDVSHLQMHYERITTKNDKAVVIYQVRAKTRDGAEVLLARSKNKANVERVGAQVAQQLGVELVKRSARAG